MGLVCIPIALATSSRSVVDGNEDGRKIADVGAPPVPVRDAVLHCYVAPVMVVVTRAAHLMAHAVV